MLSRWWLPVERRKSVRFGQQTNRSKITVKILIEGIVRFSLNPTLVWLLRISFERVLNPDGGALDFGGLGRDHTHFSLVIHLHGLIGTARIRVRGRGTGGKWKGWSSLRWRRRGGEFSGIGSRIGCRRGGCGHRTEVLLREETSHPSSPITDHTHTQSILFVVVG